MTPEPLVSVVIPAFNQERFLGEAIESALQQTYATREVIVIDDGSTDATAEVIASFGSGVRSVRQQNRGTGAARNAGVAAASGELVALLDHDDRWLPNRLALQVPLIVDPSIALVHGGVRVFRSETGEVTSEVLPPARMDIHDLIGWCTVACSTTLFRRVDVLAAGGFDEALRGTDDWDLWIRLLDRGVAVGVPQILSEMRIHATNQGGDPERVLTEGLRVVERHRQHHPGCADCHDAAERARIGLLDHYYASVAVSADAAWRAGHRARALRLRASGILRHPGVLKRIPTRLRPSS